jgi:excisionase family DNA binding protein
MKETKWLTLKDSCKYLSVSKETMYRLVYDKKVKFRKLGRLYRFKTDDLDRAMK